MSDTGKIYGAAQPDLWNHSLLVATAAQTLAQVRGEDAEVIFTVGLLHDIGKTILNAVVPQEYQPLLLQAKESNESLHDLETVAFKTDHAEVGAQLLERWNFPQKIVLPVNFHHEPLGAGDQASNAAYVYAGNVLAYRLQGLGFPRYAADPDEAILQAAGLTPEDLEHSLEKAFKNFSELQRAFS